VAYKDEKQADLDLESGFNAAEDEAPAIKPAVVAPAAVELTPAVEAPKFVQMTQEQFDAFQAAAGKTATMETQMSKVFGTLGDVQQHVRRLQSEPLKSIAVELPADVVSEMEADFPELAGHFRKGLEKALKGITGTATTSAAAPIVDPEATRKIAREIAVRHEEEALEDAHPTWRAIVGVPGSENTNEFRQWLGKQDVAYQNKINQTNSSLVIGRAIDKFLAKKVEPNRPAPKVAAQTDRIRAAIQPRGDGGQPAPANNADDDFRAGFATG